MKKIIFKGLGPTGNIVHEGKMIEDGAIVDMEERQANACIELGLAYEVVDKAEAKKIQNHVMKNRERREEVKREAKKKGGSK